MGGRWGVRLACGMCVNAGARLAPGAHHQYNHQLFLFGDSTGTQIPKAGSSDKYLKYLPASTNSKMNVHFSSMSLLPRKRSVFVFLNRHECSRSVFALFFFRWPPTRNLRSNKIFKYQSFSLILQNLFFVLAINCCSLRYFFRMTAAILAIQHQGQLLGTKYEHHTFILLLW